MGARVHLLLYALVPLLAAAGAGAAEPEGPWYFVPVHEVELQVTRTTTRGATFRRIDVDAVPAGQSWEQVRGLLERFGPCVAFEPSISTSAAGTFSLVPVADASVGRVPLSTGRSAWADFDGSVQLTPQGFLAGVNVSSEGRGPEVVRAVASTVARLAAVAAGLRLAGPDPVASILETLEADPEAFLDGRVACSRQPPRAVSSPAEALDIPAEEFAPAPCAPFGAEVVGVPAATRWALASSRRACAALHALEKQAKLVDTIRDGLQELLASAPDAEDPNGLGYQRRFEALSASYGDEYPKLEVLSRALGEAIASALSGSALTGRTTTVERARLGLDSLCTAAELSAAGGRAHCAEAWRLLDTLGVAVTGEPAVETSAVSPGPEEVSARLDETPRSSHTFFFRQPIPERFQLLRCTATATGPAPQCTAFEADPPVVEWVLHPRSGLGSLTLRQSAFRSANLSITFSELGVPATLRSSSSSPAVALTGALAEGTKVLRDEYEDTLQSLLSIDEKQRELGLADLTGEIERLEQDREMLDNAAQLEAAGASSIGSALARAQAASHLALLRARLDMGAARETLAVKAATAALAVRLTALEQEVALLDRQLQQAAARK